MSVLLRYDDIHFTYPGSTHPALGGATLELAAGQKTALLGRNGAGKSTLLLHGNGILRPARGMVEVAGAPLTHDRAGLTRVRKQVGFVFQNPEDQLFSASVRQDISFGPLNLGLNPATARHQVEQAAELCGVADLLDRPTHALSGGQKARVALAGVLAMEPSVLLADESLAGLDPWMRAQMLDIFDELASKGTAILLSTHDLTLAQAWPDQIAFMEAGQVAVITSRAQFFADSRWRELSGANLLQLRYACETARP